MRSRIRWFLCKPIYIKRKNVNGWANALINVASTGRDPRSSTGPYISSWAKSSLAVDIQSFADRSSTGTFISDAAIRANSSCRSCCLRPVRQSLPHKPVNSAFIVVANSRCCDCAKIPYILILLAMALVSVCESSWKSIIPGDRLLIMLVSPRDP